MKKKLNKIVGCIGLFVCSIVSAQQFKYSAPIADTITAKGFYAIPVTESLSSYIKRITEILELLMSWASKYHSL